MVASSAVRVWIDVTNSPHVAFFRPLTALLAQRGHHVFVTAREYAQTLELLDATGMSYEVVGPPHAGAGASAKSRGMARRLRALRAWAREREIDLALAHGSHELALVARSLRIPRLCARLRVRALAAPPRDARGDPRGGAGRDPARAPRPLGAPSRKVRRYPGLKEEYYLQGFEPDGAVLTELGLDAARVLVVLRTPPDVSLYHRQGNSLVHDVLHRIGNNPAVHVVVLARTEAAVRAAAALRLPSLVVPRQAVDALSLVALADLVVSAGGTMNREAVALGTPVLTTFAGTLGAVDEQLIADGRLRRLGSAEELEPVKKPAAARPPGRDPALLLDLLSSALA